MNVQSAQTTRKENVMSNKEVGWVRFNDGTKVYVGVQNVVKILYCQ